jgi:hypothetical protein
MSILFVVLVAVSSFGFGWGARYKVRCHAPRPKVIQVERIEIKACEIEKSLPGFNIMKSSAVK